MIPICCRTNLDLEIADKTGFPTELSAVPRVGDLIQSKHCWTTEKAPEVGGRYNVHLELVVVRVTWEWQKISNCWKPEIELKLPDGRYPDFREEVKGTKNWGVCNMYGFYDWYGRITGKGLHAYI